MISEICLLRNYEQYGSVVVCRFKHSLIHLCLSSLWPETCSLVIWGVGKQFSVITVKLDSDRPL